MASLDQALFVKFNHLTDEFDGDSTILGASQKALKDGLDSFGNLVVGTQNGLIGGGPIKTNPVLEVDSTVLRTGPNHQTKSGSFTVLGEMTMASGKIKNDLELKGTLTSGDVPWQRLSAHPKVVAGDGLSGGGNVSTNVTLNVDPSVVRTSRKIIPGSGLKGGGDLSANRTLAVDNTVLRTGSEAQTRSGDLTLNGKTVMNEVIVNNDAEFNANVGISGDVQSKNIQCLKDVSVGSNLTVQGDITASEGTTILGELMTMDKVDISSNLNVMGKVSLSNDLALAGTLTAGNVPWPRLSQHPTVIAGDGLSGGGVLSANRTLNVDTSVVRTSLSINTNNGIVGGGNLTSNRLLSLDDTVLRTSSVHQTKTGPLTLGSSLDVNGPVTLSNLVSTGKISGNELDVSSNLHVHGNLIVDGSTTELNTTLQTTDQLSVTNDGSGPAIAINQTGNQPIAQFKDDGVNVITIADGGLLGVGVDEPEELLHVKENAKIEGQLYVGQNFSLQGTMVDGTVPWVRLDNHPSLQAGDGLTGGGDLSSNRTLSVDSSVVRTERQILTQNGLIGGGDLSSSRTLSLDNTVLRTSSDNQTKSGPLTLGSTLDVSGLVNVTNDIVSTQTISSRTLVTNEKATLGSLDVLGKVTVSNDVAFTGELTNGTVPWVRLANYPMLTAGDGLSGGGDLSSARSLSVDSSVVRTTRQINTNNGIIGGGNLSSNRTLSLDNTVLRTSSSPQSKQGPLSLGSTLDVSGKVTVSNDLAFTGQLTNGTVPWVRLTNYPEINAGDGLVGGGDISSNKTLAVDGSVVRTSLTINTQDGIIGGGDLSSNRSLSLDNSVLRTSSGAQTKTGPLSLGSTLDVSGKVTVSNDLSSTGLIKGKNLDVSDNVHVHGNLIVDGESTQLNTNIQTTDQFSVTNDGSGPALIINQNGNQPIAQFKDSGSNVFIIADGGLVGIGTESPQEMLHVNGNFMLDGSFKALSNIDVNGTISASNDLAIKGTMIEGTVPWVRLANHPTVSAGDGLSGGGNLSINRSLSVDGTVVRTSRQINTGSGIVGGGDMSANRTLSLDNTVLRTDSGSQSKQGPLTLNSTLDVDQRVGISMGSLTPDANAKLHVNGNVIVEDTLLAKEDVLVESDRRIKDEIRRIEDPLSILEGVHGYTYILKNKENKSRHMGLIAQEVLEKMPEVVRVSSDGTLSVAYGNIVGVLVEAVKDLQKQIEELKNK